MCPTDYATAYICASMFSLHHPCDQSFQALTLLRTSPCLQAPTKMLTEKPSQLLLLVNTAKIPLQQVSHGFLVTLLLVHTLPNDCLPGTAHKCRPKV